MTRNTCPMTRKFSIRSELAVHAPELWQHTVNPLDLNAEFRPLLSMTFPYGVEDITAGWEPGRFQYRSLIKLGALVPVEYDDLRFDEVVAGRYFLERSTMFCQESWVHRREIKPLPGGASITDTVEFSARIPQLEPLFEPLFRWIFRFRHRNLQRIYGHRIQAA